MSTTIGIAVIIIQIMGFLTSIHALMYARTSQGAIAWVISLNTFPYLTLPIYWIIGRHRFHGYTFARRSSDMKLYQSVGDIHGRMQSYVSENKPVDGRIKGIEILSKFPFVFGNNVRMLVNGQDAFESIFRGIERAKKYILVQSYIIKDDALGRQLRDKLIHKKEQGVEVCLLYDFVGSQNISKKYLKVLKKAGVKVAAFSSTKGKGNRFQINFRNHRKVVVVDGEEGWLGGMNFGDEYMGRNLKMNPWRDTHMKIEGPAVTGLQVSFFEDWYWSTDEIMELNWELNSKCEKGVSINILHSGPADKQDTAGLMFQHMINESQERIWITSPYFVPNEAIINALKLAVIRGVDVRILIPDNPDHILIYHSAFAFVGDMLESGVRIFRYKNGFMHQKVFMSDNNITGVGTANLDNRSFRLNFEITAIVDDVEFNKETENMLLKDIEDSFEMTLDSVNKRNYFQKVLARAAYLSAPIQ